MSLSARVQKLFDAALSAGRKDTTESVGSAVTAALGRAVNGDDIQAILDGADPLSDKAILTALAAHFDAPASYLTGTTDEQKQYDAELDFYFSMTSSHISTIALRARNEEMSQPGVDALTKLINETHERYGDPNGVER